MIASIKLNNIINNLNKNLELSLDDKMVKMCEECGKRIKLSSVNELSTKYCSKCKKIIELNLTKERMKKYRKKRYGRVSSQI